MISKIYKISFLFFILCLLYPQFSYAQKRGALVITVEEKQTIRDVARKYLNDPDLWEEILQANNLRSPADVKVGMTLTIPYEQIMRAKNAIDEAQKAIQDATEAGAKSFAKETIDNAVSLYNQSLKESKAGSWEKSYQTAVKAKNAAIDAKEEAESQSAKPGEATLTYANGKVESKKAVESLWKPTAAPGKLLENDRVRTLSGSYAEVSFQDKSRIRMSENSQAVIQRNRIDLLKNRSEAKVTLEKGDAYASVFGSPTKKKFNLTVPGLETNVRSQSYWMKRDQRSTKVANYDGEIELKSKRSNVTLKKNQGSSLLATGVITPPKDLLAQPEPTLPENEKTIYSANAELQWKPVDRAVKYSLVIAKDGQFKSVILTAKEITTTKYSASLQSGLYFWHVAAIDSDGFPGPFGEARTFVLVTEAEAPFLALSSPADGIVVNSEIINITGQTTAGIVVAVNGHPIEVNDRSEFNQPAKLQRGKNVIKISALNPKTNAKTELIRNVIYTVGNDPFIDLDLTQFKMVNGIIMHPTGSLTLSGSTIPYSVVRGTITPLGVLCKTVADSSGVFMLTVDGITDSLNIDIQVITPEKKQKGRSISVKRDHELPLLDFITEPPYITSDADLVIAGFVKNTAAISMNNIPLEIKQNKFQTTQKLNEGKNTFTFHAVNGNGNSADFIRDIMLDTKPPELISYKVFPAKISGRALVRFEVKATDPSGLKSTAKIVCQIGEILYTEYLRFEKVSGFYRGNAYYTVNTSSEIKIKLILLEDQLGNQQEYNFFEK